MFSEVCSLLGFADISSEGVRAWDLVPGSLAKAWEALVPCKEQGPKGRPF